MVEFASPTLIDCAFVGNSASAVGGIISNSNSEPTLINCTFSACSAGSGAALNNRSVATLVGCTFIDNTADSSGAINNSVDSTITLTTCRFFGNISTVNGAAALETFGTATLVGCLFSGNHTVADGGAMRCLGAGGLTSAAHCTFSGNTAGGQGGGVYVSTVLHDVSIDHCILWGNQDSAGFGEAAQLRAFSWGLVSVDSSAVQSWSGVLGGAGNTGDNPLFVDADGGDNVPGTGDDDLHLSPLSPSIGGGDPAFVPAPGETDLDGHSRVLCGRVDMGAYEFGIGDFNCDRVIDLADFSAWPLCETGPDGGPYPAGCEALDFGFEGDVDLEDFAAIQRVLAEAMP